MILKYIIQDDKYNTINQVLKEEFRISSRLLTKIINNEKVLLNGHFCDTRKKPNLDDIIEVLLDLEEDNTNIKSTKMELNILYEDNGLLVINKPPRVAIHPSLRHYDNSLSNGVKYYFDKIGVKKKIRPVNRLDLDTSGLVVFAKNEYIQECLINEMKTGKFYKEYVCIVKGTIKKKNGTINAPITRKEKSIIERCVKNDGQKAITSYEVLQEYSNYSVIKCILETGRTHQIRVHMAYIGHPILGDTLYGTKSDLINRQALHCYNLCFNNPVTKKQLKLKSNIPTDMRKLIL